MKILFILFILLALVSCREEEAGWDDLTPEEQTALRNRSLNNCLQKSNEHFDDFKSISGDYFYGTGAYAVGTTFNHVFKEDSVTDYTHKITIWKITTTDIYFLIEIDDSTNEYRFLKIPKTTNDAMISSLQTKYCDNSDSRDLKFSLATSSKTYKQMRSTSTQELTHTFTYSNSLPAFFSSYQESRNEQPLDTNGDATGTAKTLVGTLSEPVVETNIPLYDTYAEYVTTGIFTTLCLVDYDSIPYSMTCDQSGATTFLSSEL